MTVMETDRKNAESAWSPAEQDTMRILKEDFKQLRDDVEKLRTDAVIHGKKSAEEATVELERRLDELVKEASSKLGDAQVKSERVAEDISTKVKENPLTSVSAALAMGMMVGRLLGRR